MLRKQNWGCFYCKNRKNLVAHAVCSICGKERDHGRFTILQQGTCYMCKVHLNWRIPIVNIYRFGFDEKEIALQISTPLLLNEFTLQECVQNTLSTWIEENRSNFSEETLIQQESQSVLAPVVTQSLFDQVLHNAERKVYDANIGRYIDKDTVTDDRENVKMHLLYVEQLKHSEGEKRRLVRESKERSEHKGRNSRHHNIADEFIADDKPKACVLCRIDFPVSQLLFVTNRSIAEWFRNHDIAIDPTDHRFDANQSHCNARVCLFCYQFFDDGSFNAAMTANTAIRSEIESALLNSPLKLAGHVALEAEQARKLAMDNNCKEIRPASAIAMDAALHKLKLKHDMANLGLRYQRIEAHGIQKGGMLDQERFGRYLRDKYSTLKDVLSEVKKNERMEMAKDLFCRSTRSIKSTKLSFIRGEYSNKSKKGTTDDDEFHQAAADDNHNITQSSAMRSVEVISLAKTRSAKSTDAIGITRTKSNVTSILETNIAANDFKLPALGKELNSAAIIPKAIARKCPLVLFMTQSNLDANDSADNGKKANLNSRRVELQTLRLKQKKVSESTNQSEQLLIKQSVDTLSMTPRAINAAPTSAPRSSPPEISAQEPVNNAPSQISCDRNNTDIKESKLVENEDGVYEDDFENEYRDDEFETISDNDDGTQMQETANKLDSWLNVDIFDSMSSHPDMLCSPRGTSRMGDRLIPSGSKYNLMEGQALSARCRSSQSRSNNAPRKDMTVEILSPSSRASSKRDFRSPSKPRSVKGRLGNLRYFEKLETDMPLVAEPVSSWFWDMGEVAQDATNDKEEAKPIQAHDNSSNRRREFVPKRNSNSRKQPQKLNARRK